MHLQIDFLLEEERRSGSAVRGLFLLKLAGVLAVALLLGIVAYTVIDRRMAERELEEIQQQKKALTDGHREALRLQQEALQMAELSGALAAWTDMRLDAAALMYAVQETTPRDVQLVKWMAAETCKAAAGSLTRDGGIFIKGRAGGARPEAAVEHLRDALATDPRFTGVVEQAAVKSFGSGANEAPDIRVFEMECTFRTRSAAKATLKQAAGAVRDRP